ncbi:hypothetical protein [Apibacter adventoris]|nr:hypothetical protein [Apibacter adventoris]
MNNILNKKNIYKLLVFFSISGVLFSCQGQERKNRLLEATAKQPIPNDTITERFNIDEFNKHQKNGSWLFTKNNQEYFVRKVKDEYWIEISRKDNPFILKCNYYLNGNIKIRGLIFHGNAFTKGIVVDYDERGNIIKQTDYDAPYKDFPWEKVKLWLENRKVNLLDPFTRVWRENENNHPIWYLSWDTKEFDKYGNQIIQEIELDGRTGKLLKETTHTFGEYIPEEYKNDLDKKEDKKTSSNYKTYEGKDYTREEWEEFEQKQFEAYARKHNISIAKNDKKDTHGFTSRFI